MDKILEETRIIVREMQRLTNASPKVIELPRSRLMEFVDAAASAGLPKTTEQIEQLRRDALDGKAKCWGVPVRFVPDTQ